MMFTTCMKMFTDLVLIVLIGGSSGFFLFSLNSLFSQNVKLNGLIVEKLDTPPDFCGLQLLYEIDEELQSTVLAIDCDSLKKINKQSSDYVELCYNEIIHTSPGLTCSNISKQQSIVLIVLSSMTLVMSMLIIHKLKTRLLAVSDTLPTPAPVQGEVQGQRPYDIPMQEIIVHDASNVMIGENIDKKESRVTLVTNP